MKSFEHHHLEVERDGDCIILRQIDHSGNAEGVYIHVSQLRYVAEVAGVVPPETAEKISELERRISILTDKLQNLVCNKAFRGDLIERCGDGFEYLARLDCLLDLSLEFDGGRLKPEYKDDEKPAPAKKPQDVPSVSVVASAETTTRPISSVPTKQQAGQLGFEV